MTPEARVKQKVETILKNNNVWFCYPVANVFTRYGIPDILACVKGRFLAIECKAGNNRPTSRQEYEHARIRESGGIVLVINEDNIDLVEEACTK